MSDPDLYPVSPAWAARAHLDAAGYEAARAAAREAPGAFWAEQARRFDWMTAPTWIRDVSFKRADSRIRWFGDGVLNVAYNCLDRHLAERGDETAIIWEGGEPSVSGGLTYRELHAEVCPMANGATKLMLQGVPNYPDYSRVYTAPHRAAGLDARG